MSSPSHWSRFLTRQASRRPLVFVNGSRHTLKKGVCCDVHSHRTIEIVYHARASGCTRLKEGRSVAFREKSAVIYAPRETHDQVMDREGEDFCIQIACPDRSPSLPKTCLYIPIVESPTVIEDIRILSNTYARLSTPDQAIFNLRATATLFALINLASASWLRESASQAELHVQKAEQFIRDHLPSIGSLGEIARAAGISHDYLRHVFKKLRGKSLVRHLNEVRVDRAKSLLIHSRLPMKQIASLCGFADEYYFSATFRKFTHTPPSIYRQTHDLGR